MMTMADAPANKSISSAPSSPSDSSNKNKRVSFHNIQVHEHAIILGDNPSAAFGVPITIDWQAQYKVSFSVDAIESSRRYQRSIEELRLPAEARADLAILGGSSVDEIQTNQTQMIKIQKQRAKSAYVSGWEKFVTLAKELRKGNGQSNGHNKMNKSSSNTSITKPRTLPPSSMISHNARGA